MTLGDNQVLCQLTVKPMANLLFIYLFIDSYNVQGREQ